MRVVTEASTVSTGQGEVAAVVGVMQDPELLKKDCSSVQCLVASAVLGTLD